MGHIINPISYRLSKSKFWISSWNNISKKNYKILIFEDHNLIKLFNWFREYNMWKKFNIVITNIKFLKFYNRIVVNINMGLLDYYYPNKYLKNLPLYHNNKYMRLRVNYIYNKSSKLILNNILGKFLKYYISRWDYLIFILKNESRFIYQVSERLKITGGIYKKYIRKGLKLNINNKFYELENNNSNKKSVKYIYKKKFKYNLNKIINKKEINDKKLSKKFFDNFLKFIRYNIIKSAKKNRKLLINNNIFKVYNNYNKNFNFSKYLNKFFFKNYKKAYSYKFFELNVKKDIKFNNLINNYNYINYNKYNILNYNYINFIRDKKIKSNKILKNIKLYINFFYKYNIMNNSNSYNNTRSSNYNLLKESYKKDNRNKNNKKAFYCIYKNNHYSKILYLRHRFNFSEFRLKKLQVIFKDSNWNSDIKKEFFIGIFIKNFLIFLIKKIFHIKKNILINIYENKHGLLERNALGLKKTILVRITAQYRIGHLLGILKRKLANNKRVKGFRIKAVGRYQKKLRNKKIEVNYGRIRLSNINTPLSYINFIIIYKFGTCGIKINLLRDSYNYEIF